MKDRFDRQIECSFKENLKDIHASEDLIARTLARIREEEASESSDPADVSASLSPININYVMKTKADRKNSAAGKAVIGLLAAAITGVVAFGALKLADRHQNADALSDVSNESELVIVTTISDDNEILTSGGDNITAGGLMAAKAEVYYDREDPDGRYPEPGRPDEERYMNPGDFPNPGRRDYSPVSSRPGAYDNLSRNFDRYPRKLGR